MKYEHDINARVNFWRDKLVIPEKMPTGSSLRVDYRHAIEGAFSSLLWQKWGSTSVTTTPVLYTPQGLDALALMQLHREYSPKTAKSIFGSSHSNIGSAETADTIYVGLDGAQHKIILGLLAKHGVKFEDAEHFKEFAPDTTSKAQKIAKQRKANQRKLFGRGED